MGRRGVQPLEPVGEIGRVEVQVFVENYRGGVRHVRGEFGGIFAGIRSAAADAEHRENQPLEMDRLTQTEDDSQSVKSVHDD